MTTPVPDPARPSAVHERLEELLDRVEKSADPDRCHLVREFARIALRRVPDGQLAVADPEATVAQVTSAFAFSDERAPGELALRAFTPEVALDGWSEPGTVIEICVEDRPFLLSTATETLRAHGHEVVRTLHPIFGVRRDADGRLTEILPARTATDREAFVHLELDGELSPDAVTAVVAELRAALADTVAATDDHDAMRAAMRAAADDTRRSAGARYGDDEADEAAALLEWLLEDNFVLLGWREYEVVDGVRGRAIRVRPGSGLGVLRDEVGSTYHTAVDEDEMEPELRRRAFEGDLLAVSRTNRVATVHRRRRMDYVGIKKVAPDGTVGGEYRLVGLFTRKAFSEPAADTPVVRRRLQRILEREDVVPGSHDEVALTTLYQALPKDELFQTDLDTLHRMLMELAEAEAHEETRVLVRHDAFTHLASVLLAVPQDQYSPQLRRELQEELQDRFAAERVEVDVALGDRAEVVARFTIHGTTRELDEGELDQLQREVRRRARSWLDEVTAVLVRRFGEADGRRLERQLASRTPQAYRDATGPTLAADDIHEIDRLVRDGAALRVRVHEDADGTGYRVKAYPSGAPLELSGFLPILESLGMRVVEERPYTLQGDEPRLFIHDFGVRHESGATIDLEADGDRVAAAILAARSGATEIDALNRLVVSAGLDWYEVTLLRAYRRYRRQIGTAYSTEYINDALNTHPVVARALVALFATKFDPQRTADAADIAAARQVVIEHCDAVERLDHDRILRGFTTLVDATVRTSYYRRSVDERGAPYLALKFDGQRIPGLPDPTPYREIFVFSPAVEGIHLRGGPVARGGLRWSDRMDDVRTEVLGLMKAQMLKNAVIVPTGAKGGFVVKDPPVDAAEAREEVRRQYVTFVRALLEVTDNLVDGQVVAPVGVRRHDGDDPYLVVAADKGTATFSDTANAIAASYDFWLGDAFASGGSNGYDHKALGITARGAWVAVERHFRELDLDVASEPFTVVGIGDMSGDVFGNGMLQSPTLELVAAFDHRHIFLDPDPDAARSFEERQRLFGRPGSSWADYDPASISDGGGVYARSLKSIPISEPVRGRLRIEDEALPPPDLIRAILAAPVDLLWAGGIGTYVKASTESHADAGDRANDEVRVDATDVRARVVGEGANLSFTQRARVQYARRGGHINMDAIDNSAGVDISDHEVNVKILLGLAVADGDLDPPARDALLEAVTGEVVAHVLRDNHLQTWRLSQEAAESPRAMDAYEAMLQDLESQDLIDRTVEALPSTEEMSERSARGAGLTRPELCVLMGYAKRDLTAAVLRSAVPDLPALGSALADYFPRSLVERFPGLLNRHRLRRELIATWVSNDLVNRLGITFASRLAAESGRDLAQIAAAYWAARDVADADPKWRAIEDLDALMGPQRTLTWKREVDKLVEGLTRTYLVDPALPEIAAIVERDGPTFRALEGRLLSLGTDAQRTHRVERMHTLIDNLVEPDLAEQLACLRDLALVPDLAGVIRASDRDPDPVALADAFLRVTAATHLDRLARRVDVFEPGDRWQRWERAGLLRDLRDLRSHAVAAALREHPDASERDATERYLARRAPGIGHARELITDAAADDPLRLDAAGVAARALRDALGA